MINSKLGKMVRKGMHLEYAIVVSHIGTSESEYYPVPLTVDLDELVKFVVSITNWIDDLVDNLNDDNVLGETPQELVKIYKNIPEIRATFSKKPANAWAKEILTLFEGPETLGNVSNMEIFHHNIQLRYFDIDGNEYYIELD